MSLLSLERVTKRYLVGGRLRAVLDEVSLDVDRGELVAVWGRRRSGRTTLLRVAGGLDEPDEGMVRFGGHDLADRRDDVLGDQIAFARVQMADGRRVLDHLTSVPLARGERRRQAIGRAHAVLEQVEAAGCADLYPRALSSAELTRVMIARALVLRPKLLLVDEPTTSVDLLDRDPILRLLHAIAADGTAILMTATETPELTGARALWLDNDGHLQGDSAPAPADVLPLHPRVS